MGQKKASKERTPPYRHTAFELTLGTLSRASEPRGGDRKVDRWMGKSRRDEGGVWHTSEVAEVLRALGTDAASGLSDEEAARRLAERGPNELEDRGTRRPWLILWEQFTSSHDRDPDRRGGRLRPPR